jgi:hypothetical protein
MEISRNADITIANGESLSNAIDLNDRGLCALLMPAAWRAAKTNIPAQTCATSTRTQFGVLTLPDSDGKYTAQFSEKLPSNWTGAIDLNI